VNVISGEGSSKGGGWTWVRICLPASSHLLSLVGGREEANNVAMAMEANI